MQNNKTPFSHAQTQALLSNGTDATASGLFDTVVGILVVTTLHFSVAEIGVLNALGSVAFLVLVVPLGALVDRAGAAPMLIASLLLKIVLVAVTIAFLLTGMLSSPVVMAIVTVFGVASVTSENAQTALVPRITSSPSATAVTVARMASADQAAGIIAPALAAVLLATAADAVPLVVSLSLLLLALLSASRSSIFRRVRTTNAPEVGAAETAALPLPSASEANTSMLHGFRVLFGNRLLLASTLLTMAGNIGLAIGDTVEDVLILRTLNLGVVFFGVLGSLGAIAGLLASIIAPHVVTRFPVRTLFGYGAVTQAIVAALPLCALLWPQSSYIVLSLYTVLWALVITVVNIAGAAYAAQIVDSRVLGRASAARRMFTMGCVPFATLGGGILADAAGMIAPLILWPALTLTAALTYFLLTRP